LLTRTWKKQTKVNFKDQPLDLLFSETKKFTLYFFLSGTAEDSLGYHRGQAFTTRDRDNDKLKRKNCADNSKGGWWYKDCHHANLNGLYEPSKQNARAMIWMDWKMRVAVKRSEMKIRPVDF